MLEMQRKIPTRIPGELEKVVMEFKRQEVVDKSTAIRRILQIGIGEWKRRRAIDLYRDGKITLWKASQIAGLPLREMLEELNRLRIITHVTVEDIEEDIKAAKKAER